MSQFFLNSSLYRRRKPHLEQSDHYVSASPDRHDGQHLAGLKVGISIRPESYLRSWAVYKPYQTVHETGVAKLALFRATSLPLILQATTVRHSKAALPPPDYSLLVHPTIALKSPLVFHDRGRWILVPQRSTSLEPVVNLWFPPFSPTLDPTIARLNQYLVGLHCHLMGGYTAVVVTITNVPTRLIDRTRAQGTVKPVSTRGKRQTVYTVRWKPSPKFYNVVEIGALKKGDGADGYSRNKP